jgi:hypothetical protein
MRYAAAHLATVEFPFPVPPVLLRAWLGRVQAALLRGVRLRSAAHPQTVQLALLANELDAVAEQIRCALGIPAKTPRP